MSKELARRQGFVVYFCRKNSSARQLKAMLFQLPALRAESASTICRADTSPDILRHRAIKLAPDKAYPPRPNKSHFAETAWLIPAPGFFHITQPSFFPENSDPVNSQAAPGKAIDIDQDGFLIRSLNLRLCCGCCTAPAGFCALIMAKFIASPNGW